MQKIIWNAEEIKYGDMEEGLWVDFNQCSISINLKEQDSQERFLLEVEYESVKHWEVDDGAVSIIAGRECKKIEFIIKKHEDVVRLYQLFYERFSIKRHSSVAHMQVLRAEESGQNLSNDRKMVRDNSHPAFVPRIDWKCDLSSPTDEPPPLLTESNSEALVTQENVALLKNVFECEQHSNLDQKIRIKTKNYKKNHPNAKSLCNAFDENVKKIFYKVHRRIRKFVKKRGSKYFHNRK